MNRSEKLIFNTNLAYYLTLIIFFAASFFSQVRLWGVNIWAYLPLYARFLLLVLGAAFPILIYRAQSRIIGEFEKLSNRAYIIISGLVILVFTALFYFLKIETHFLGDGYQVISNLADGFAVKSREFIESFTHKKVFELSGATGKAGARAVHQVVSITSGFLLALFGFLITAKIFKSQRQRILFAIGVISGGYTFLYFGYVEHYSLFVLVTFSFVISGLLIAEGKLTRWLAIPLALLASGCHILGVTLLPGAFYLTFAGTSIGDKISSLSKPMKWTIFLVFLAAAVTLFGYRYSNDYFFRFAIVPLVADRFTVEGYTLFSLAHILDVINLLFLLLPPVLIITAVLIADRTERLSAATRFLLLTNICCWGAVFLFDPKLGMPRDWDLFAFAGVSTVVGAFYYLSSRTIKIKEYNYPIILSVGLSLLVLLPRAIVFTDAENGIAIARDYTLLDPVKNRNVGFLTAHYLRDQGDTLRGTEILQNWLVENPENTMVRQAVAFRGKLQYREAAAYLWQVLERNPHYSDAWSNLAEIYIQLKMGDTAVYCAEIADGLNPNSPPILNNLGMSLIEQGNFNRAEKVLKRAIALDSTVYQFPFNIAHIYRDRNDYQTYIYYLNKAAGLQGANWPVYCEIGEVMTYRKNIPEARRAFSKALELGMDSAFIYQLDERYPGLIEK